MLDVLIEVFADECENWVCCHEMLNLMGFPGNVNKGLSANVTDFCFHHLVAQRKL